MSNYFTIIFCFYHYVWIHLNLNGEKAQTTQNLNNEHVVFKNYMNTTYNKVKILIKYV